MPRPCSRVWAHTAKVPICWLLVSHRLPALIFGHRIYHHYFDLHISATLNKQVIGIMNIMMNITLTNMCLVCSIQKNPSTMVDNERRSSCHHACQLFSWEISVGWIMVTSTRPPALCAGEAPDEKLQINELGPNMIGSRAESQLHIHSINKYNDPNLAFADLIVWPAIHLASRIHSVLQHWLLLIYVSQQPVL